MSWQASAWVQDAAPVENQGEGCVLYVLANYARADGTGAWPSQATIAQGAWCSTRTVRRHLKALEGRGVIVRGDQSIVPDKIPVDRRPIVWDLNLGMRRPAGDDDPDIERADNLTGRTNEVRPGGQDGSDRADTGVLQTTLNPPKEKEGVEVSSNHWVGGGEDSPPSPDSPRVPADAVAPGTTPADWSTPDDPRCRDHAGWERSLVPACGLCRNARAWFQEREAGEERRRVVEREACGYCDERGLAWVRAERDQAVAVKCDHSGPPSLPELGVERPAVDLGVIREMADRVVTQRK